MNARILYAALIFLTACGGASEFHTGPASAEAGPRPPTHTAEGAGQGKASLATVALQLTTLSDGDYDALQDHWVSSREAACNHFVATALCVAEGGCDQEVKTMLADAYDTYLLAHGWEKADLAELKRLFSSGEPFDAILQNDGNRSSEHGHVSIPVRMSADGKRFDVAEGELDGASHKLQHDADDYVGTERIFVRRQDPSAQVFSENGVKSVSRSK